MPAIKLKLPCLQIILFLVSPESNQRRYWYKTLNKTMMFDRLKGRINRKINNYISANFVNRYDASYSLENWFYYWLYFQNFDYAHDYTPKNCYYEFGTGRGGTLTSFLKASTRFSKEYNFDILKIKIVLLDSFKGLPEIKVKEDDHYEWSKGGFAGSKDYITGIIKQYGFPLENVTFVEGYYEDSLTGEVFEKLKNIPPSIVTMDVDYYSSTKLALNFIAPFLKSGTVFYFDDIYSFFMHPGNGQIKAISEFNQQKTGHLSWLPEKNYTGRCYMYSREIWEHRSSESPQAE